MERLKEYTIKKLNLDDAIFDKMMNAPNKFFMDYPSNYNLIYNNIKHFKWLISKLYSFKPMSIEASEMIKAR
jgi:hypothetical protein